MKKNKNKNIKNKIKNMLNSYKVIIYISFIINIILILFSYYLVSSNKIYTFGGKDEYIEVTDGFIALNNDINVFSGNNIKYINDTDYEIIEYKIGYYVMDNNKLVSIITTSLNFDNPIKLSELINNFNSFNLAEKNNNSQYFNNYKKKLIEDNLYIVLEAKTNNDKTILSKIKLNVSKISKH